MCPVLYFRIQSLFLCLWRDYYVSALCLSEETREDFACLLLVPSSTTALANSMWRNCEICQVLSTEAFTSFCQACDGTVDSSFPRHHCLLPTHVAGDGTALLLFYSSCSCSAHAVVCLMCPRLLGLTLRPSAPVCVATGTL